MASVTLAESAKLSQDLLVAGVIESIITVNPVFNILPFDGISGNALAYNRENVLGDVTVAGVNDTFTSLGAGDAAATFTQVTSQLTTIMGNAKVNGLIQATRSNMGNDQAAVQIASKAKSAARKYQDLMINGTGASNEFNGLLNLTPTAQKVDTGTNGTALSFEVLDEMMDLVTVKDGVVDYFMMNARTIRSYFTLLRALGGAGIGETVTLPGGAQVPAYRGVPIFRNDYIPVNQTKGASSNTTTVFAGCFDDGSRTQGITGLTAETASGIRVEDAGLAEDADNRIYRIVWYCGLALFSEKAIASAPGITD